jgi:hypothetical protein
MKTVSFLVFSILIIAGCTPQKISASPTPALATSPRAKSITTLAAPTLTVIAPTTTNTPTVLPSFTVTSRPSLTRIEGPTSTRTRKPTATPTAPPTSTDTPAITVQCPEEIPELVPDFQALLEDDYADIPGAILSFLNAGGRRQAVIDVFQASRLGDPAYIAQHFLEIELTGDKRPELVIGYGNLYIFGCIQNAYQVMVTVRTDRGNFNDVDPRVETVRDLNVDGTPEIVITSVFAPFTWVRIYQWDGEKFLNLVAGDTDPYLGDESVASMIGAQVSFLDTDGNGTLEIILKGGIPSHLSLYYGGYPWRLETDTYRWNGEAFEFYRQEFGSPEYRFQAVQDGDRASLRGDYEQALGFYQEAIFNDQLEWWSQARRETELACFATPDCPTPTPAAPAPDPNEYYNLAAYARFRIMLLHILRGYLPEATIVYQTLQSKFPAGQAGYAFAEIATLFWDQYQSSLNIEQACNAVTQYVKAHPVDILAYLGNGEYEVAAYGDQSLYYRPEDVCPFK